MHSMQRASVTYICCHSGKVHVAKTEQCLAILTGRDCLVRVIKNHL